MISQQNDEDDRNQRKIRIDVKCFGKTLSQNLGRIALGVGQLMTANEIRYWNT